MDLLLDIRKDSEFVFVGTNPYRFKYFFIAVLFFLASSAHTTPTGLFGVVIHRIFIYTSKYNSHRPKKEGFGSLSCSAVCTQSLRNSNDRFPHW